MGVDKSILPDRGATGSGPLFDAFRRGNNALAAGKPRPLSADEIAHVRGMEVEAFRRKVLEADR